MKRDGLGAAFLLIALGFLTGAWLIGTNGDGDEAERMHDLGRSERAREETAALLNQLEAAGRGRVAASHAERARQTVTKRIKEALARIATLHPELGAHLGATVRRGYFCVYLPDPQRPIDWQQ